MLNFRSKILSYFKGLYLPLNSGLNFEDEDDYIIVRFLPDDSFCFSTKARVPTKISVECIKIKDAKNWDLYLNLENNYEDQTSIENNFSDNYSNSNTPNKISFNRKLTCNNSSSSKDSIKKNIRKLSLLDKKSKLNNDKYNNLNRLSIDNRHKSISINNKAKKIMFDLTNKLKIKKELYKRRQSKDSCELNKNLNNNNNDIYSHKNLKINNSNNIDKRISVSSNLLVQLDTQKKLKIYLEELKQGGIDSLKYNDNNINMKVLNISNNNLNESCLNIKNPLNLLSNLINNFKFKKSKPKVELQNYNLDLINKKFIENISNKTSIINYKRSSTYCNYKDNVKNLIQNLNNNFEEIKEVVPEDNNLETFLNNNKILPKSSIKISDTTNNEILEEEKLELKFKNVEKETCDKLIISNKNFKSKKNHIDKFLNKNYVKYFECSPFGKDIATLEEEIKFSSPFKFFKSYKVFHFIAKSDDDLRQELMVLHIIKKLKLIFDQANIPLKLRPYSIEVTSSSSGLIEFLPNTNSIDGIKKYFSNYVQNCINEASIDIEFEKKEVSNKKSFLEMSLIKSNRESLYLFYKEYFKENYDESQINFTQSLAAYSLVCYLLQIKDRHNGNILIDKMGNIIHIDFGFVLGISPGNLNFECAPFKLTNEYLEILDDQYMIYFKTLLLRGFLELKKHRDYLVNYIKIMSKCSKMPCFDPKINNDSIDGILKKFKERFHLNKSQEELKIIIDDLVIKSINNFWTNRYDNFQYLTNGIRY